MVVDPPLELLFERADLPSFDLPPTLVAGYGGPLGFGAPRVIANFVASVDGVVALPDAGESGHVISQGSEGDRFVMGLLRACADAVIVGAGTFRKAPGQLWTAEAICPAASDSFAEARRRLGRAPDPTFVTVTGSGLVDTTQRALREAILVTTAAGAVALGDRVPSNARVVVLDPSQALATQLSARLQAEGLRILLVEGGPSLVAQFLAENALDELFLTVSPSLFGRWVGDRRTSLADGIDLAGTSLELLSLRRHRSYTFFRYAVRRS